MMISHYDRLQKTLSGEKPDRIPVAFWQHFPVDDQSAASLAKATIAFERQFDFDLIKVSPPSSFCLKDWGVKDEWQGNKEGTRAYTHRTIHEPGDWKNLNVLDPHKGFLGKQLQCLNNLEKVFSNNTPTIQTIFNPLSQAKNLLGPQELLTHLRQYPDALHEGLKTIQETTLRFIYAAKEFGISGIFYAVQHASYQILNEKEYLEFGKAYDIPILEAVNDLWLNMVHIHGNDIMFDLIADYPVQILNWHDRETPPSLADALRHFSGSVCGGIGRIETLVLGSQEKIQHEAQQAISETGGKRLILGTGCVLPLTTPYGNIMAVRKFVEEVV